MINLLPDEEKREIRAGRANSLLVRYLMLFGLTLVVIFGIFGFVYLTLSTTKDLAVKKKADNDAQVQTMSSRSKEIATFQQNLSIAKQILDKQINYSTIILRISSAIPKDVILADLSLDVAAFDKPFTLTAKARTEDAATELKKNISQSKFFKDVRYSNILYEPESEDPYKYSITIDLVLNKEELLK